MTAEELLIAYAGTVNQRRFAENAVDCQKRLLEQAEARLREAQEAETAARDAWDAARLP